MSNSLQPKDYSPPDSSLHGVLQARIQEWVAFPSPGHLPGPGTEPASPASQADSLQSDSPGKPTLHIRTLICNVVLGFHAC